MVAYDKENIFAKIIKGDIPCYKVFETEHAIAILDAFPMVPGHSLLLPKHPCVSVTDMPAEVAASVLSELPRLARAVQQATGAPGVNIVTNSGKEAGQVVFHAHFHVIPRFDGDKLVSLGASRTSMLTPDEAKPLLAKMSSDSAADGPFASSLAVLTKLEAQMRAGEISAPPPPPAGCGPTGKPAAAPQAAKKEAAPKGEKAAAKPESPPKGAKADGAKGGKEGGGKEGGGTPPAAEGKVFNTEKKVKVKKAAAEPAEPEAERPLDISWADVRVGLIVDAKPHPDSDKLYIETIDLGEAAPRQILSGLAHHMKLEEVIGARVVCICNLKARKLAGWESNGMVLCANDATSLSFVVPPEGTKPGDRITWEGYPGAPMEVKKMDKKKGWEGLVANLLTDKDGNATYKGTALWKVGGGVCTTKVPNGTIK